LKQHHWNVAAGAVTRVLNTATRSLLYPPLLALLLLPMTVTWHRHCCQLSVSTRRSRGVKQHSCLRCETLSS